MIRVINRNFADKTLISIGINIMSPNLLGNPYRLGKDGDRVQVARLHKRYLWNEIKRNTAIAKELWRLARLHKLGGEVIFVCCCKPHPCHGDNLAAAVRWMAEQLDETPS